jgi:hypothetical protein
MKLPRAMKRVTGRLTIMRLITGQLNGHAKGQWSAQLTSERLVTGQLNGREEGQWSAEWP